MHSHPCRNLPVLKQTTVAAERGTVRYTAWLILFQVRHHKALGGGGIKISFCPVFPMAIFAIVLQQQQQKHWKTVLNSKLKHAYGKRQLFKLPSR